MAGSTSCRTGSWPEAWVVSALRRPGTPALAPSRWPSPDQFRRISPAANATSVTRIGRPEPKFSKNPLLPLVELGELVWGLGRSRCTSGPPPGGRRRVAAGVGAWPGSRPSGAVAPHVVRNPRIGAPGSGWTSKRKRRWENLNCPPTGRSRQPGLPASPVCSGWPGRGHRVFLAQDHIGGLAGQGLLKVVPDHDVVPKVLAGRCAGRPGNVLRVLQHVLACFVRQGSIPWSGLGLQVLSRSLDPWEGCPARISLWTTTARCSSRPRARGWRTSRVATGASKNPGSELAKTPDSSGPVRRPGRADPAGPGHPLRPGSGRSRFAPGIPGPETRRSGGGGARARACRLRQPPVAHPAGRCPRDLPGSGTPHRVELPSGQAESGRRTSSGRSLR